MANQSTLIILFAENGASSFTETLTMAGVATLLLLSFMAGIRWYVINMVKPKHENEMKRENQALKITDERHELDMELRRKQADKLDGVMTRIAESNEITSKAVAQISDEVRTTREDIGDIKAILAKDNHD